MIYKQLSKQQTAQYFQNKYVHKTIRAHCCKHKYTLSFYKINVHIKLELLYKIINL